MPRPGSEDENTGSVVGSGLQVDPVALAGALTSIRKDLEYLIVEVEELRKTAHEQVKEQKLANGRTSKLEWEMEMHRNEATHGGTEKRLRKLEDHEREAYGEQKTWGKVSRAVFNGKLIPWLFALAAWGWLAASNETARGPF